MPPIPALNPNSGNAKAAIAPAKNITAMQIRLFILHPLIMYNELLAKLKLCKIL